MPEWSEEQSPRSANRSDDGWVSLAEAAERTGADEPWLLERCREGTLPSRPAPDDGLLVPLATAEALASRTITE